MIKIKIFLNKPILDRRYSTPKEKTVREDRIREHAELPLFENIDPGLHDIHLLIYINIYTTFLHKHIYDFAYKSIIFFFISALHWGSPLAIIQNLAPQLINTVIGKIRRDNYDFILPLGYMYPFDPVKNWGRYLIVYFMQCYSSKYFHFITMND